MDTTKDTTMQHVTDVAIVPEATTEFIAGLLERIERLESDLATAEQDSRQKQARIERLEEEECKQAALLDCLNEWKALAKSAEKERDDAKAAAENIALKLDYLRSKLETAKNAQNDWLRANAPGGWIDNLRIENEALRAKIEAMEKQKPVGEIRRANSTGNYNNSVVWVPMVVGSKLYALPGAQPAPNFADAYQGAMEEVAIWKKRALEAEDLNRKFVAEINGPTYMGGPAQPAPSVPEDVMRDVEWKRELFIIKHAMAMNNWDWKSEASNDMKRAAYAAVVKLLSAAPEAKLVASSRSPSVPDGWLRAIDEALVTTHIGVANAHDTYEQAKAKLDNLIGFHVDVATDPAVNGGWKLVPIEVVGLYNFMCAAFVPMTPQQEQIAVQLELAKRAMLAAAPEDKP